MARPVTEPRTETELRVYVEKCLRRAVSNRAWARFVRDREVDEVLIHGADLDEFTARVADLTAQEMGHRPTPKGEHAARGDWIEAREYAVSRVIAQEMSQDKRVIGFRRDLLGPQAAPVAPDRLSDWAHARYYEDAPPNWHERCQWCRQDPTDTSGAVPLYGAGKRPSGARERHWFEDTPKGRKEALAAKKSGEWTGRYDPRPLAPVQRGPDGVKHFYPPSREIHFRIWSLVGEKWRCHYQWVPPTGQLAELATFAGKLASDYNIDEPSTATFIVTGTPPQYSAAGFKVTADTGPQTNARRVERLRHPWKWQTDRGYRSRIELSIDPALTADEVRDIYARVLRDYFPSDQRHARPNARSMRAAGEVIEIFDGKPSADAWRSWNLRHPDEQWKAPNGRVPFRQQVLTALRHLG